MCEVIREELLTEHIVWSPTSSSAPEWTGTVKSGCTVTDLDGNGVELTEGEEVDVFADGSWRVRREHWFADVEQHLDHLERPAPGPHARLEMLCGGFVLYAALKAGRITGAQFKRSAAAEAAAKMLCDLDKEHITVSLRDANPQSPEQKSERDSWAANASKWSPAMRPDKLVIWVGYPGGDSGAWNHIAVATGEGDNVYSLWEAHPDIGKHPRQVRVWDLLSLDGFETYAIKILAPRWHT